MSDAEATIQGNGRTILVLDDDPSIRNAIRRILERSDFEVIEAEEAREALHIVRDPMLNVDLVICDLVLPGLGGREAGNALQARVPDTPILFTSGYSSHFSGRREVKKAGQPFLGKPFEAAELLDAVEKLLDG